jgi:tRNA 2-thiouridine synthesizing protein A
MSDSRRTGIDDLPPITSGHAVMLDLRGVKCPLNWAHARVRLEQMNRGEVLELLLDDPRGVRDIPRAAEAEGYAVAEPAGENGVWRLRIEK